MAGASTKAVSDEVEGQWRSATGLAMVLDSIHTSADPSRSRSRHHSPLSLKEKVEVSSGPAGVPICTLAPLLLVAWMTCGAESVAGVEASLAPLARARRGGLSVDLTRVASPRGTRASG